MTHGNRTPELEPEGEPRESLIDTAWDAVPAVAAGMGEPEPAAGMRPKQARELEPDLFASMLDADEPLPRPWSNRGSEPPRLRAVGGAMLSIELSPPGGAIPQEPKPGVGDASPGASEPSLDGEPLRPSDAEAPQESEPEAAREAPGACEAAPGGELPARFGAAAPQKPDAAPEAQDVDECASFTGPSVLVAPIAVVGELVPEEDDEGDRDAAGCGRIEAKSRASEASGGRPSLPKGLVETSRAVA